ncbi:MAG TPA: glutamate 5-kinase [Geminicoccus sp.]|uniref:glutamate 5-kinase n=1 Tax=Geminicoccus sp. TaxID=2024832 RepID=UPI002E37420D|nr:glutamate 5-kinase [Geminicoccus sp.]HEX2529111.1 glutamate 5-kinase [Geminicoccus sp.]
MTSPFRVRRLVVKVGSSLLVQPDGNVRKSWVDSLTSDLRRLRMRDTEVIVVSSGAIALGRRVLGLPAGTLPLEQKQAAAAVGQIRLAAAWADSLAVHDLPAAQILLTLDDTEARRRYLNARSTFAALLAQGAVPVVNENDTVATSEIRFGDNDRLSARVAVMASAETLVLLSDVDGLYTADPRRSPDAGHIPVVDEITPEIEAMAGGAGTAVGTGGMVSKLVAARIATRAGCSVVLTRGDSLHPLNAAEEGARSTLFRAKASPHGARKHWIAAALGVSGVVVVDEGAARALLAGSSLLPAGVRSVEGRFERGDAVLIRSLDGRDVAKGLIAYDAEDAVKIVGLRSHDIERTLGYRGRDELIHRDDLVLL